MSGSIAQTLKLSFNINREVYSFETSKALDLSLGVKRDSKGVNCFHTNRPRFSPFSIGSFTGNVALGGACNVDVVTFTPHGNGTHTECIGHITAKQEYVSNVLQQGLMLAQLISIEPKTVGGDQIIGLSQVEPLLNRSGIEALIIRTLPNSDTKRSMDYSGQNPAYFEPELMALMHKTGILHFLCDVPSVDREEDGGRLLAHKAFFGLPDHPRPMATITEMIYAPSEIEDGLYLMDLQIFSFESDAVPSRPLLYKLNKEDLNSN